MLHVHIIFVLFVVVFLFIIQQVKYICLVCFCLFHFLLSLSVILQHLFYLSFLSFLFGDIFHSFCFSGFQIFVFNGFVIFLYTISLCSFNRRFVYKAKFFFFSIIFVFNFQKFHNHNTLRCTHIKSKVGEKKTSQFRLKQGKIEIFSFGKFSQNKSFKKSFYTFINSTY